MTTDTNRGGGALAKQDNAMTTVRDMFTKMESQLAMALPKHLKPDRFIRVMLTEIQRNPKLLQCTPKSLCGALMEAAQLGLEVTGPLGQGYIIPYGTVATFQPGYKGLRDLAYNSKMVTGISGEAVREKDAFKVTYGMNPTLVHEPDWRLTPEERGDIIGVYVVARMKDAEPQFKFMSKAEVDAHKARFSKAWQKQDSPWQRDWPAMALKTCFIQLFRWLPCSVELQTAMLRDIEAEQGMNYGGNGIVDVTPQDDDPEPDPVDPEEITDPKQAEIAAKLAGNKKAPKQEEPVAQAEPVDDDDEPESRTRVKHEIKRILEHMDADSRDEMLARHNLDMEGWSIADSTTLMKMHDDAREWDARTDELFGDAKEK